MKNCKNILAAALCALLLSACGTPAAEAPPVDEINVEDAQDLLAQMDTLYESLDTAPLALQGAESYTALGNSALAEPQLVMEDATAKQIATAVSGLLDAYGNGLGNYAGSEELSLGRTTTALWHTAPVDFTWEMDRDGNFTASEQSHVLAALVKRELASGRTPYAIYYAQEVDKTAAALFGPDARVTHQDVFPYYYYEKEGVYLLMEEIKSEVTVIPQVLSYEKTADGFQAEVVLVDLRSGALEYNGQKIDKTNFSQTTADAQRLRYVLRDNSGALTLQSLEAWRPGQ